MATLKQVGKGAMESTDMVDEIAAASARQQEILSPSSPKAFIRFQK
ncbi:MAG: hypothetical protein ACLTBV_21520 [Enterocloster bolteae]